MPLEAKLIAWAVAAAALLAGLWGFIHHEREIGAAKVVAAQEKQHAKDVAAAAAETHAYEANQVAAAREADKFRVQAHSDARDVVGTSERVQHHFDALNAGCVSDHPTAAPGSPPASSAADLRSLMFSRLRQAATGIGAFADDARAAGQQAQDSYPVKP